MNAAPFPSACIKITCRTHSKRSCEIVGEAGKILVDIRALTVEVFDGQGNSLRPVHIKISNVISYFLDELNYFLDGLQGKQVPLVSLGATAHKGLRMALAAKESMALVDH